MGVGVNVPQHDPASKPLAVRDIIRVTEALCGLSPGSLAGPCRKRPLVLARHAAMLVARHGTDKSLPQIGRAFRRDHTSVIHGLRAATIRAEDRAEYRAFVKRIGAACEPPVEVRVAARCLRLAVDACGSSTVHAATDCGKTAAFRAAGASPIRAAAGVPSPAGAISPNSRTQAEG